MKQLSVGDRAPSFRLPSAQGPEVGLEDYRGRANLILFFAKGMACGFCRQKMSQLARGADRFRALETEILMVAPTPLERGQFYARNFSIPYPYLCDPEYRAFAAYGLTVRPRSLLWKVRVLRHARGLPAPEVTELGEAQHGLRELTRVLNDDDLGCFIADKEGTLHHVTAGPYVTYEGTKPVGMQSIPSNEDIVAVLEGVHERSTRRRPA
jgi:peroxiredoxin